MDERKSFIISRMVTVIGVLLLWGILALASVSREIPVGSLKGKVYEINSKRPIAGARVNHPTRGVYVKTDEKGEFTLYGVPAGTHYISVYAKGYRSSYNSSVKVQEGKLSQNLDFPLEKRNSYYYVTAYQKVFSPGQDPCIDIRGYLVKKIQIKIYRVDPLNYLEYFYKGGEEVSGIPEGNLELVHEGQFNAHLNEDGDFYSLYKLPVDANGVYIIKTKAVGGRQQHNTWLVKSDVGLVVKRSPKELLIYAQSFSSGKPMENSDIRIYNEYKCVNKGNTDVSGLYSYNNPQGDMYVVAMRGNSFAFARSYYGSNSDGRKIYTFTERPIYRPDQTVYFKSMLRDRIGNHYSPSRGNRVRVRITDNNGEEIYNKNLTTNEFGSVNGSVKLAEEPPLGYYSIEVTAGDYSDYCGFQVAEYRKPEYKVELTSEKPQYVSGDTIRVKAKATYYFGGPVKNAQYRLTVFESPYRWSSLEWDDYTDYDLSRDHHYGGIFYEKDGILNPQGEIEFVIPTKKINYNRNLAMELEVTDLSHRTVTGNLNVPLSVGEFALYAYTEKYLYKPGEEVLVRVSAQDFNEKPMVHQKISAQIWQVSYKEVKKPVRTRTSTGRTVKDYEYRMERQETQIGTERDLSTDEDGKALFSFTPDGTGSFIIRLSSWDLRGNQIKYIAYTYISEAGGGECLTEADLKIIKDKKIYKRGDTVKALITTSQPDSYVLLTLEGRKIFQKQVLYLKDGSYTLDIPLRDEYFPNLFISAAIIKNMELVHVEENVKIEKEDRKLQIAIQPDKEKYNPGDKAKYTIKVTDFQGKPVKAEFSIGVVDQAIYAIAPERTPDIYEYFWAYDDNYVYTDYSFYKYYSGGLDKDRPEKIRKKFVDTAFWAPSVVSDEQGNAVVEFEMPDNLTTWVTTLRASTMDTRVGSGVNFVICAKDLLVRLETPRFLTQRDKIYIGGVVHNYTTTPQKVKIWLEAEGVELKDPAPKLDTIANDHAKDYYWEVVANTSGTAKFTLLCKGETAEDAMELTLPVHPHGVEEIVSHSGFIKQEENSASMALLLPQDVVREATQLEIILSPSIANTLFSNLDYLITYPYGCVEQTMSAFMPALAAKRVMDRFNMHNPILDKQMADVTRKSLGKIYSMQHYDGGWGWWETDATHPYMTAYVVLGLKLAQSNGIPVKEWVINNGLAKLKAMVDKDPAPVKTLGGSLQVGEEWNTRAYLLYVLSRVGDPNKSRTLQAYQHCQDMNDYSKAVLAMTLNGIAEYHKAQEVMDMLDKTAEEDEKFCHWKSRTFTYSWTDNPVESTAYCLMAYNQLRPDSPRIPKIINWLVNQRKGKSYHSTKDTAVIIFAFVDHLMRTGEMKPDYKLDIALNGHNILNYKVNHPSLPEDMSILTPDLSLLKMGENRVDITKDGKGSLYYTMRLRYFPATEGIQAKSRGFQVKKRFMTVDTVRDKKGNIVEETRPLSQRPLQRGEIIRIQLEITPDYDYQYVLIEDPLPAGFEVTIPEGERNEGSQYWTQQEIRDEKVCYFINQLEKGKVRQLSYDVRAEMAGDFHVMPATAFCMYEPEVRGHSQEKNIQVKMK